MAVLLGLAAFAIYAWVAPPVSGPGDGPEFTIGLATAGLVHPTGYPLYMVFGHWFARAAHAFGVGWPLAANLWSGVGAGAAVSLCFTLARGVVRDEISAGAPADAFSTLIASSLPAILLALNPLILLEVSKAEVNTWSLAWTLGAVALFLRWLRRLESGERSAGTLEAVTWCLLCGAGLAHHRTSLLVSVPLTVGLGAALARRGLLGPRLAIVGVAAALLPLLSYGFVAWRALHPAPGQWPDIEPSAASVLAHITGERYRAYFGFFAPDEANRRLLGSAVYPFLFPGFVCVGIAAVRAVSPERRAAWWSIFSATLLVLLFTLHYGVSDPAPYLLPALGLTLIGVAPAFLWLFGSRRLIPAGHPLPVGWTLAATALVVAMSFGWHAVGQVRTQRAAIVGFDDDVRRLWALVPPDSAIVLWPSDQMTRLVEYQVLRMEKPAVWVTTPELLLDPAVLRQVRRRYGLDLMEGLEIPYAPRSAPWGEAVRREFFGRVIDRLNAGAGVPVYWFDPTGSGLTLIPK